MYNRPVIVDDEKAGMLLEFNTTYKILRGGIGQCPCAIVEYGDGSVDVVPVECIRFTN
jgi:hypothetical protein